MTVRPDTNGYISRGNMTIVMSAAGLVMVAFGSFFGFLNSATDRRITDLKEELSKTEQNFLRKDEHAEFKYRIDRDNALLREAQLRRDATVVPRSEHEARWKSTDDRLQLLADNIKLISDRLNEVRSAATGSVTLRDEIGRLHTQLDDLRRQLNERPAGTR